MTVLLAILAAIFGGLIGGFAGFLVVVALGYAVGSGSSDGGIEMGAALVGAPIGLVAGAILGCLLVLRARRGKGGSALQGWIALGSVVAVLLGLYGWLFYEPPQPYLAGGSKPRLLTEVSVPWDEVDPDAYRNYTPHVQTIDNRVLTPSAGGLPAREGDAVVWRSTHDLAYDFPDRQFYLWVAPRRVMFFDLDLPGDPPHQANFTGWRPVSHVREHSYGEDLPGPHGALIRFRIDRR